jgi:tol-pal system protein YbgF
MRIRTHRVATASALTLLSACASAPAATSESTTASHELSALRAQQVEQTRRISELEARLSLIEADARRTREPERAAETVVIGGREEAAAVPEPVVSEELEGKRPSLKLYGNGMSSAKPSATLPSVPQVNERLPVVPLPEQRAAKALRGPDDSLAQYKRGLRSLQERQYDQALTLFAAFLSEHPKHELASSALYWRGEALYAKREYSAARAEFEALLARFPSAPRAPDALLKLGLSFQKLGASDQADDAFQRLRTTYPNSQAAEAAASEGST